MNQQNTKQITIAIDGHSSCGKSTLAKALATELNYVYIDTGAMYRGVTLFCHRNELVTSDSIQKSEIVNRLSEITISFKYDEELGKAALLLNGENVEKEIRTLEISQLVSHVASIKEVREKLVEEQRKMGQNGGVILDGRDIGSVVFPNAELKLFVTANSDIRTQRRYEELLPSNPNIRFDDVKKNLLERDHIDSTREESPLIKTHDAIVLDNSEIGKNEQLMLVLGLVREILN
jgi:cytidylate kinase